MCHCLECQRRTGAVISNQARFHREQITFAGQATAWSRKAEERERADLLFLSDTRLHRLLGGQSFPDTSRVAIANFADQDSQRRPLRCGGSHVTLGRIAPDTPANRVAKQG